MNILGTCIRAVLMDLHVISHARRYLTLTFSRISHYPDRVSSNEHSDDAHLHADSYLNDEKHDSLYTIYNLTTACKISVQFKEGILLG